MSLYNRKQSAPYKVYRALLLTAGASNPTSGSLTIGWIYSITNYVSGDDFTNVADVISGTINTDGCIFICTATTPTNWAHGSELHQQDNITASVKENTIGEITWFHTDVGKFRAVSNALFVYPNTVCFMSPIETISLFEPIDTGGNYIVLYTEGTDYTFQDGWIGNTSVEILVYP